MAAASGAVLLAIAEAGGYAIDAADSLSRHHRPGLLRARWVATVGIAGGAAGWLVVAIASGLRGLGDAALGAGVLAGACLIVLVGMLAESAVAGGKDTAVAVSRPSLTRLLRRAPSLHGHQPGRGPTPARRRRPDR